MGLDMYFYKKDNTQKNKATKQIMYWRKANAIHKWFGLLMESERPIDKTAPFANIDIPVNIKNLTNLLSTIEKVLNSSHLIEGKILSHTQFKDNVEIKHYVDGKVLEDSSIAEEYLPTMSGFYFGDTTYDQYYIEDLQETKIFIEKTLAAHKENFEYFYTSWA